MQRREQEGRPSEVRRHNEQNFSGPAAGKRNALSVTCCVVMTAHIILHRHFLKHKHWYGAAVRVCRQTAALFKQCFVIFFFFKYTNGQLVVIFFQPWSYQVLQLQIPIRLLWLRTMLPNNAVCMEVWTWLCDGERGVLPNPARLLLSTNSYRSENPPKTTKFHSKFAF